MKLKYEKKKRFLTSIPLLNFEILNDLFKKSSKPKKSALFMDD